jgi:hypothetical protein
LIYSGSVVMIYDKHTLLRGHYPALFR